MSVNTLFSRAAKLGMNITCVAISILAAGCGGGASDELSDATTASVAHDASTAQVVGQANDGATGGTFDDVATDVAASDIAAPGESSSDVHAASVQGSSKIVKEPLVVLGANVNYVKGQWLYYGGMWGRYLDPRLTEKSSPSQAGGATNNYYVRTVLSPSAFPNSWTQTWVTPSNYSYTRPGNPGVYGYLAASYCNYDNGLNNPAGCVQRQVDSITGLVSEFALTIAPGGGGTLGDFNVLHEFYLTSARGNLVTKQLEVGVFLHASDGGAQFHAGGKKVGTFTDQWGISWTCARNGTFVTFLRSGGGDLLKGSFDWRGALTFLKGSGQLQGSWWFNGIGLGVEPSRNGGTLAVQNWAMTYR